MVPERNDLAEFEDGFSDGYAGVPCDRSRGITYLRAYRAGVEAEKRDRQWMESKGARQ